MFCDWRVAACAYSDNPLADNYNEVPLYKTIEQLKRSTLKHKPFHFQEGDKAPERPPSQDIWQAALQNRKFKTVVICIICRILSNTYKPPRRPAALVIDFVNVLNIEFTHYKDTRQTIDTFKPMGEGDVKFMRHAVMFGSLMVESVDSDVLLIAMRFVSAHNFEIQIFVKRIASKSIDDDAPPPDKDKKRKREKKKTEYEIIDVQQMLCMLHGCFRQAVGSELCVTPQQMTDILVFQMLLSGSDFSRKMPQLGAKFIWESLHISAPLILMCLQDSEGELCVDEDSVADMVLVELYKAKYPKYVRDEPESFDDVYTDLQSSKLSEKTRASLPDRTHVLCTIRNIQWIINYWSLNNKSPATHTDGRDGFVVRNNKLDFGIAAEEAV